MKLAVISDSHLGHGYGTELQEDSFVQFEEALDSAIAEKADLILLPGDIFDTRTPRQEVWARALNIFQKPLLAEKNHTKLEGFAGEPRQVSPMVLKGVPVVAIHGTHERRSENLVNPVELLEQSGHLIHLHKQAVVFEVGGHKLAIHGLSGIPERDVKKELQEWNPRPVPDAYNIFVFHQSTNEEIYDPENTFLSLEDLPKGFDFYIDGHIHWAKYIPEKKFLLPGSTVITQKKQKESTQGKGFYMIEVDMNSARKTETRFVPLKKQRKFFFKEFEFTKARSDEVNEKINSYLSLLKPEGKPLVRIKLTGIMDDGLSKSHLELHDFSKYGCVLSVDNQLESTDFKSRLADLRKLQQAKMSVSELGMSLLAQLLEKTDYKGLPPEQIIGPLADGDIDFVMKKIEETKKAS
ncbi:MAG: DNA repair exonuclease [Candidatus Micrarchaeota archaeon]